MFGVDDPAVVAAVRAYVKLMRATRSVAGRLERALAGRNSRWSTCSPERRRAVGGRWLLADAGEAEALDVVFAVFGPLERAGRGEAGDAELRLDLQQPGAHRLRLRLLAEMA